MDESQGEGVSKVEGFEYVLVEKDGCSVGHKPAGDEKHNYIRRFGGRGGGSWEGELGSSLVSDFYVCGGFHDGDERGGGSEKRLEID